MKVNPLISRRPFLLGQIVFLILLLLTQILAYQRFLLLKDAEHREVASVASAARERIQTTLNYSFATAKILAFIVEKFGEPGNFDSLANSLLRSSKFIDAVQLTRKGTIIQTYPLKGNEPTIGYDILADSGRNKEALKAITKKDLYFSGPFELKQGGIGIVGRQPIFINHEFWGFAAVIIRLPTLLRETGISNSESSAYTFELSKINPNTQQEEFFLEYPAKFKKNNYQVVEVPDGEWNLYVQRKKTTSLINVLPFALTGLLLSIVGGLLAWNIARQPAVLKKQVIEKTKDIYEKEKKYRDTLERISDAFVSLDKNWCYTYMNKKAGEIFNRDPEKMTGRHIWTEFPEGVGQPFHLTYERAMKEQEYIYFEEYYPPYDKWFENHIYPSPDGLSIFFRDITEKKKQELLLKENEERYHSIYDHSSEAILLTRTDGTIISANPAACKMFGRNEKEIIMLGRNGLVNLTDQRLIPALEKRLRSGKVKTELTFVRKDGTIFPAEVSSSVFNTANNEERSSMLILDITERKTAENILKESEEQYRSLIEQAMDGIIVADESGKILQANHSTSLLTGYSLEELQRISIHDLIAPDGQEDQQAILQRWKAGENILIQRKFITKNGAVVETELSGSQLADGRLQAFVRDITERKKTEADLKNLNENLRNLAMHLQTIREEERKHISREIHDELGQQLTAIKMDVAWIEKNMTKNIPKVKAKLVNVIHMLDGSNKAIRKILRDLRMGVLDHQSLPDALNWQCEQMTEHTGIPVLFTEKGDFSTVSGPVASGIYRILQESLTNISRYAKSKKVTVFLEKNESLIKFEIADDGQGFQTSLLKTTKSLGILGMKERVNSLHGQFDLYSAPGKGTRIVISIPLPTEI